MHRRKLYIGEMYCCLVNILREDGSKAEAQELGRIVIKLPLPPGCVSTLYRADERFAKIYFSTRPVSRAISMRDFSFHFNNELLIKLN